MNSRFLQAVTAMSEFLAANPPNNQGLLLNHLPHYVEADLNPGFDIDAAGLTSAIHIQLAKVSRTLARLPKLQLNTSLLWTVVHKGRKLFGSWRRATSHFETVPLSVTISRTTLNIFSLLRGVPLVPSQPPGATDHDVHSPSSWIYSVLLPCGSLRLWIPEYVKSLHHPYQKTKDPLPEILDMATLHNRSETAEYCNGAGARVVFRNPDDLNKTIMTGYSYDAFMVLIEHSIDINTPIDFYGVIDIVLWKMTILIWFAYAWRTMPIQP